MKSIAFILPNEKAEDSLYDYVCSIEYLEKITGLDFFYKLPDELLNTLNHNLKHTSKNVNGYERLSNLCKNKGVNYGQAKKIKHEMENGLDPKAYKLVGGDDLLVWLNDKLTRHINVSFHLRFCKLYTNEKKTIEWLPSNEFKLGSFVMYSNFICPK